MGKKLRVGVIGVGNIGQHHARIYSELSEAELVAVADISWARGKEVAERYQCKFYQNYRKLFDERLDAVSVAVPTSLHKTIVMDCLKGGIPVLVEKPIANNLSDAEEMVRFAWAQRVLLAVGHIERFNPAVQKLREFIQQGKFDQITSIWIKRVGVFPPKVPDTDVIVDLAVHDIDVCNFLLSRMPRTVYARAGRALASKMADYASVFIDYHGTDVLLQVNWLTPVKVRQLSITGTKGYAELDYINQTLMIYENNYEKTFDSYGDFTIKFGTPNIKEIKSELKEPLKLELEGFLAHVRGDKGSVITAQEGFLNLLVALKAVESYKWGKIVEIGERATDIGL